MDIIEKKKFGMTFYEFNGRIYDNLKYAEDAKRVYEAKLNRDVADAQKRADKANAALEAAKSKITPAEAPVTDVASMSDDDLIAKRNAAEGDERQLYQNEINKRSKDGQPHSWDAADKALQEKRAEKQKQLEKAAAQETAANALSEVNTDEINNGSEKEDNLPEDNQSEKSEVSEKPEDTYKDSYWRNLIYGNGHGLTKGNKDAKEEKAEKYDEFLKNDPSTIKAIFGKNSGLNAGERLLRLGSLLSTIGGNAALGAAAGIRGNPSSANFVQNKYDKIYQDAMNKQYERKSEQFASEQEAKNTVAKYKSAIDSNPTLAVLPVSVRTILSENIINGLTEEEFAEILIGTGFEGLASSMYKSFQNVAKNNASVTTQQGNVEDVKAKKLTNEFTSINNSLKTAKECNDYIAAINDKIKDLQDFKLQVRTANQDQYFQYIERYLGYLSGVQTVSNNAEAHRDSNWNAATEVKGGIPVVHGSVSAGGGHDWGSSEGQQQFTDTLRAANIPVAEQGAADWTKERNTYIKALEAEIDKQIKYWQDAKAAAQERAATLTAKADASVNDGVIKAPNMKQWLVREDGTKIELNPSDNIYATKNELKTDKDNGSDVVPIEKEDRVVVVHRNLGYTGGNINKNFDYYLNKLRG